MPLVKNFFAVLIGIAFVACLVFMIVWCFIAVSQLGKQNKDKDTEDDNLKI